MNHQKTELAPFTKTDWIRFGALKVQAKSKRIWQIIAIVAIVGVVAVTVIDGWLFMEREIRLEKLANYCQTLKNKNWTLTLRLSSLNLAMKEYGQIINTAKNEKNQLAVEKGVLCAQVDLLISQIENLEAEIIAQKEISPSAQVTEEQILATSANEPTETQ